MSRALLRRRVVSVLVASVLAACIVAAANPASAEVDTIFVVPGAHFDVGFDDLPSVVRQHRIQAVEDALAAAERDPDFHWMEDAGWGFGGWLERFRDDAPRMARARRALRSGQLVVGAVWVSPHGAVFHESLDLLLAPLDAMQRLLGFRPRVAVLDDAPSQPEALVDALAARGVRYLLFGANMTFSSPLPRRLVRSPFWWESSRGARVLVYIDPNSYGQAATWPWDADTARFAAVIRDPDHRALLSTAERGFRSLLAASPSRYDALLFENAGDDASVPSATSLPAAVRDWNRVGLRPRLVLASPLAYFQHVEARYGARLPVLRGEWGGEWDPVRATCPVWTWRLREAMKRVRPDAPLEVREALATAMDHGLTLGPGWPGKLTEAQTVAHAREQAQILARAVASVSAAARAGGASLVESVPALPIAGVWRPANRRWPGLLADSADIRLRVGRGTIAPFVPDTAPTLEAALSVDELGWRRRVRARLDRRRIPGADTALAAVVLEVPLRAPANRLRLAPVDSRPALQGRWLPNAPPAVVVAPAGVRVTGLPRALEVSSPLAFSYTLRADPARRAVTWLQILLLRQQTRCEFKDGAARVLPFEDLYPGEPAVLDTWVEMALGAAGRGPPVP